MINRHAPDSKRNSSQSWAPTFLVPSQRAEQSKRHGIGDAYASKWKKKPKSTTHKLHAVRNRPISRATTYPMFLIIYHHKTATAIMKQITINGFTQLTSCKHQTETKSISYDRCCALCYFWCSSRVQRLKSSPLLFVHWWLKTRRFSEGTS